MKKFLTSLKLLMYVLLIVFIVSCSKDSPTETGSEILKDAFAQADEIPGIKSLVILKDGRIIKEKYWRDGSAGKPHDVRSVTKSVVGLLIGIAIDNGFIKSEEDSIGKYLKQVYPGIKEQCASIKIKHLLTMSGGFSGNELANPSEYGTWITSPNQVNYVLNKPIINPPGFKFAYNSGALHLLSVILSVSTKMSTHAFAKQYLFDPLNIPLNYWESDKQGYNNGGAGLNVSPYDMIKIGYLILHGGEYGGKRIISKEWIDKAAQSKISTNNAQPYGPSYGYCFWTGQNTKGSYVFANGYGGQFIINIYIINYNFFYLPMAMVDSS